MTCIVAVVSKGQVFMGGDSAGMDSRYGLTVRTDRKVFRNGDFLIGFTDSFRMGQLLQFSFNPPKPRTGTDVMAYMVTDFIDAARQCLKGGGWARIVDSADKGGTFLVGYAGRIFQIYGDFQVGEAKMGFDACGSADFVALGSLYTTRDWPEPDKRLLAALNAAEELSGAVRGPFFFESTVAK